VVGSVWILAESHLWEKKPCVLDTRCKGGEGKSDVQIQVQIRELPSARRYAENARYAKENYAIV
jgi:hypothetical protein